MDDNDKFNKEWLLIASPSYYMTKSDYHAHHDLTPLNDFYFSDPKYDKLRFEDYKYLEYYHLTIPRRFKRRSK